MTSGGGHGRGQVFPFSTTLLGLREVKQGKRKDLTPGLWMNALYSSETTDTRSNAHEHYYL